MRIRREHETFNSVFMFPMHFKACLEPSRYVCKVRNLNCWVPLEDEVEQVSAFPRRHLGFLRHCSEAENCEILM